MKINIARTFNSIVTLLLLVTVLGLSVPTHQVKAAAAMRATEGTALVNARTNAVSAVANTANAANTTSLLVKETMLDGIGWAIAKQMVSSMTKSLLNWINSGFEGSPAFITDLNGFLLDALDTAAGEYIKSLGGIGEFICSPFKLDVQAALTISYAQARSGMPSGATAPACKLTDIKNNIEGFFAGISDGGWGEWLQVTSNPQNTPYGAYLEAQARLKINLRNEAGQEIEIANWGEGFLSKKICEGIEGTSGEKCTISTPGQVISEALTFQLSTGPRSLIEADEINEIIGALLNQLTLKAVEGINGLLGLSGGTGYTDYSLNGSSTAPYIDDAVNENILLNAASFKRQMDDALTNEISYRSLASSSLSTASTRLTVVSNGQSAINNLFSGTNSGSDILNLSKTNTLAEARTKLSAAYAQTNSSSSRAQLDDIKQELDSIENSLNTIVLMSTTIPDNASLSAITFAIGESEGTRIQTELTSLVAEMTPIIPTIVSNITNLTRLVSRYEAASTTATTGTTTNTASSIRQNVILDFVTMVNSNVLHSPVIVSLKRAEWERKLGS